MMTINVFCEPQMINWKLNFLYVARLYVFRFNLLSNNVTTLWSGKVKVQKAFHDVDWDICTVCIKGSQALAWAPACLWVYTDRHLNWILFLKNSNTPCTKHIFLFRGGFANCKTNTQSKELATHENKIADNLLTLTHFVKCFIWLLNLYCLSDKEKPGLFLWWSLILVSQHYIKWQCPAVSGNCFWITYNNVCISDLFLMTCVFSRHQEAWGWLQWTG